MLPVSADPCAPATKKWTEPALHRVYGRRTQGTAAFSRARGRQAREQSRIYSPGQACSRRTASRNSSKARRAFAPEASSAVADPSQQWLVGRVRAKFGTALAEAIE